MSSALNVAWRFSLRALVVTTAFALATGTASAQTVRSRIETSTISASPVRICATSQLKITVFHTAAALGTVGGYIGFTNRASAPCRLAGWPMVVALTVARAATMALQRRSTMFGPYVKGVPELTLRHGERAGAVFTGGEIAGPGKTSCGPPYRYLRVTPPGNSRSVFLSAWNSWLGKYLPNCGAIEVSMLVPSSALYHG